MCNDGCPSSSNRVSSEVRGIPVQQIRDGMRQGEAISKTESTWTREKGVGNHGDGGHCYCESDPGCRACNHVCGCSRDGALNPPNKSTIFSTRIQDTPGSLNGISGRANDFQGTGHHQGACSVTRMFYHV